MRATKLFQRMLQERIYKYGNIFRHLLQAHITRLMARQGVKEPSGKSRRFQNIAWRDIS
jgi:hypothetical protein